MNRGYQNLKQLEDATVKAVNALEGAILTEGNTASHQLEEVKVTLLSAIKSAVDVERGERLDHHFENAADIARVGDTLTEFMARGFWSRLNWLLIGR